VSGITQLRCELLRAARNPLTFGITVGLPLVVFLVVAGANRHTHVEGIVFPVYFMGAMASYGAMFAAIGPGARISRDRSIGWIRQLRITPLRTRTYFASKVATAYLVVVVSIVVLFAAGTAYGVHMTAGRWLELAALVLVGVAPLVAIGLAIGHLLAPDSLTPAVAGTVVVFALLGGEFGPLFPHGTMLAVVKLLPSYWLVQASKVAAFGRGWPAEGWLVVAAWTAVMLGAAGLAYRRDTARI
jgi:ABC-2 type transport system permease protein